MNVVKKLLLALVLFGSASQVHAQIEASMLFNVMAVAGVSGMYTSGRLMESKKSTGQDKLAGCLGFLVSICLFTIAAAKPIINQ